MSRDAPRFTFSFFSFPFKNFCIFILSNVTSYPTDLLMPTPVIATSGKGFRTAAALRRRGIMEAAWPCRAAVCLPRAGPRERSGARQVMGAFIRKVYVRLSAAVPKIRGRSARVAAATALQG